MARKRVVFDFAINADSAHLDREIISLAPPQDGVNRARKGGHAIASLRRGAIEPIDAAIRTSDIPVGARCNVDDDLAAWRRFPPVTFHGRRRSPSERALFSHPVIIKLHQRAVLTAGTGWL